MSRSKKRRPAGGNTTARSEKKDKKKWHRRLRQQNATATKAEKEVMPKEREVSNVWAMAKDGKQWSEVLETRDEPVERRRRKRQHAKRSKEE